MGVPVKPIYLFATALSFCCLSGELLAHAEQLDYRSPSLSELAEGDQSAVVAARFVIPLGPSTTEKDSFKNKARLQFGYGFDHQPRATIQTWTPSAGLNLSLDGGFAFNSGDEYYRYDALTNRMRASGDGDGIHPLLFTGLVIGGALLVLDATGSDEAAQDFVDNATN